MAQAGKSKEPSMEEILASIRRLIAEDDPEKSARRPAAASVELNRDAATASVDTEPDRGGSPPWPESPAARIVLGTAKAARSSTAFDLTEPMTSTASRSAAPGIDSGPARVPPPSIDHAVTKIFDLTEPMASAAAQAAAPHSSPTPMPPGPIDHALANEAVTQSGGAGGAQDDHCSGLMSSILSGPAKAARSSTIFDFTEPMSAAPAQAAAPTIDSRPAPVPPAPIVHAVANEAGAVTQSGGAGVAQDDEPTGLMSSILSETAKAARSSSVLDWIEPIASSPSRSAAPAVDSGPAPVPPARIDQGVANEAVTQSGGGAQDDERSELMSGATSAAIDSAFNALAQTVLVHNARTLEDLVRGMLRPMLKVWLDDNLPGIVERLVRAEIERVSRGRGG